ncbi:MAG: hypothetical protein QOF17_9 [Solirubrobacteraceae bacterium]|nr:hypothetical protein [Solirubrobacteraceae bacterium]
MTATAARRLWRRAARRWRSPPTALLVPVAGIGLDDAAAGLPPHVTVLYPFVPARRAGPELERDLRATFAHIPAFDFALTSVGRFPGVLYLAPEPAAPFAALTEACTRRWPEHPPYAGAYDEVVPHLTLAEGPEPPGLAEGWGRRLPLRARAEALWLMAPGPGGRWRRVADVPLGGVSGSRASRSR